MQKLEELIQVFSKLQGIGKKSATKLAFDILNKDKHEFERLIFVLSSAYNSIKECKICHCLTENEVCDFCNSDIRNNKIICVVESFRDVLVIENSKNYNGLYHVLGGLINPLNGIMADNLNIQSLIERLNDVDEIIFALNGNLEGQTTCLYINDLIREVNKNIRVTKIASGVPLGANIEQIDAMTLNLSFEARKNMLD